RAHRRLEVFDGRRLVALFPEDEEGRPQRLIAVELPRPAELRRLVLHGSLNQGSSRGAPARTWAVRTSPLAPVPCAQYIAWTIKRKTPAQAGLANRWKRVGKNSALDRKDLQILRLLQADGARSNRDLAREIGLSASACLERVRRLERDGVIERYTAVLRASAFER